MRTRSATREPTRATLAVFLSCVRINILRSHCVEPIGSTAIFVNVAGGDRNDHTAVP
jgi:hypothetical protein